MTLLNLLLGVFFLIAGVIMIIICGVMLWAAGPIGIIGVLALLKLVWWLAGKDWGIARRIVPPNFGQRATPVHRKPGKPDSRDPLTHNDPAPQHPTISKRSSLDDPGFRNFDSFGLR